MHALPRRGDVSNPWVREGNLYADFVVQAIWLLAFLGHRVIVRASVSSRLWLYPKMKDVIQRCGGVKAFVQMCDMGHEQKKGTHLYGFNVPWLPTMQAGRLLASYPFRSPPYVRIPHGFPHSFSLLLGGYDSSSLAQWIRAAGPRRRDVSGEAGAAQEETPRDPAWCSRPRKGVHEDEEEGKRNEVSGLRTYVRHCGLRALRTLGVRT